MHLSPLEEYGIRCALRLARLPKGETLAASKVADDEGISIEYASKIMHLLKNSQIVTATRGVRGGFLLTRSPSEINMLQVIRAVAGETDFTISSCGDFKGQKAECVHQQNCSIRPVWGAISSFINELLEATTLAHLLDRESQVRPKVEALTCSRLAQAKGSLQIGVL